MAEEWTTTHAPMEAYDRLREQLDRAEQLLREIRDGKHSVPGTLVQIDRYFEQRGQPDRASDEGQRPAGEGGNLV